MRVAHFGGFDAANYGDQLFSLIFARRLARHADVVHVSPTGKAPPWADAAGSVSFAVLRRSPADIDAIVIGGGNLIYTGATPLVEYDDGNLGANLAYPSLWLGAAELAADLGVPLAWNAPGVRRVFSAIGAELVSFATSVSDFISVRDTSSRELLRAAGVEGAIECVVDSGIGVETLWSDAALKEAYRALFLCRGMDIPSRAVALHINERYVTESRVTLARRLDRIAHSLDATPLLLALGPCHGDDRFQGELAARMASMPVVVGADARLIDFAASIAHAYAFAGSSLHGMTTACAFGTPAVVVAVERPAAFQKFSGLLEHVGDAGQLCSTWAEAEERLPLYVSRGRAPWPRWDYARNRSVAHWERLIATCATPLSRARRDEKTVELLQVRRRVASQHQQFGVATGALVDQARDAVYLMRDARTRERERSDLTVRAWPSVDVIICVHNALEDVRACFEALSRTSQVNFRVLVVNDGSDAETTHYLRVLADSHPRWRLRENALAQRYTTAANQALSVSTADYVVLLNSDTITPPDWLSKLVDCGESSAKIGLIGPLSNAAGWQSVPMVHSPNGDWMVNKLPSGMSVDSMAGLVGALAAHASPLVPMLNGFCLAVKRPVLDAIGHFDCDLSPAGYAEEIDFCFRAADAGYAMAIADSAYVYHAKSRSYGHEMRLGLARVGKQLIQARYGEQRLEEARRALRDNEVLALVRGRVSAVLEVLRASHDAQAGMHSSPPLAANHSPE